jgi:cell wall-associated NlpC family hydrolase
MVQRVNLLRVLKPGDVLLYAPKGVFGWIISVKTWHRIAHVECYIGAGFSVASRDGLGVGKYPVRDSELALVCRPLQPFDLPRAMKWFERQKGTPYGWADLLQFAGMNVDATGIVCSPFITRFLRNGGLDPFNGEDSIKVAPFEFELSPVFQIYEVSKDGSLSPRVGELGDVAS